MKEQIIAWLVQLADLLPPELAAALKTIDPANPDTFKTAATALAVIIAWKLSRLFVRLLFKGAAVLAKKTKATWDDEAVAEAQKSFDEKYGK